MAKTVDVLVNAPAGVELVAAWANHPDFKVEIITVTPRTHYRVKVTPPLGRGPQDTELRQDATATPRAAQAVILLKATGTVPPGANLTFYARVK